MALDPLAIKNMALDEVPAQRIETEDEASIAAEAAARAYQPALELLLEDFDWGFATRRQVMAEVANERVNEWGFAYRLPSDMARPRALLPFGANNVSAGSFPAWGPFRQLESRLPFRISGQTLHTNREAAVLEYISNAPQPSSFTAKFARALALEIASRIVMPITKDRERQGDLIKAAEVARERAKAEEMNRDRETIRDFTPESLLVRAGITSWR